MKANILIIAILISALQLPAQTNGTVRLALVSESPDALAAADVLTAELSSHKNLQLLERNEIERVYREQGLSAANTDYLKLGQVLGADGLLLLDINKTPQATNLTTRLVAVKPGAVLLDEDFSWPMQDMTGWASLCAAHLNPFVPKLAVLLKDAIPLSVVNLRSAVQSGEAQETERQLKLLAIQRLSREPQLFVLERQKMQLLTEEKELKLDDSAFWNGSYLLEGVVDQNGYSKDTITINARLTPPKGGTPVPIEVSGSRTNFMEVINQLAAKVNAVLKVSSTVKEWNAADEAAQYLDEAKWAMKWAAYPEAQASSESAWALGKHDEDCAAVRVRAYMAAINTGGFREQDYPFGSIGSLSMVTNLAWNVAAPDRPWGLTLSEQVWRPNMVITFAFASKYPDVKNLDRAIRALEVYQEFSQTLPPDNLKTNSAWFDLGVKDLTNASVVLLHFNFVPSSQKLAPDKLERLRFLARSVAGWISSSPSVRDTYWVKNPEATKNEPVNAAAPHAIFGCEVTLGCLWQEKPEDSIALYRELMTSPAFRQIHQGIWFRPMLTTWNIQEDTYVRGVMVVTYPINVAAVTAWNDEDRKRIPTVWSDFIQELKNSTNRLFQIEAEASTLNPDQLAERDGEGWVTVEPTENDQAFYKEMQFLKDHNPNDPKPFDPVEFATVFQFRDYSAYQANKIEYLLRYFQLILDFTATRASGEDKVKFQNEVSLIKNLQSDVSRILNAEAEAKAMQGKLAAFEKQKQFLTNNQPFDPNTFDPLFTFGFKDYTKAQALEIKPLLAAYKTNLTGNWLQYGKTYVGQVEDTVNRILNSPPAPKPSVAVVQGTNLNPAPKPNAAVVRGTNPVPIRVVPPKIVSRVPSKPPEIVTNILTVANYFRIPADRVASPYIQDMHLGAIPGMAYSRWTGGKWLLDLQYSDGMNHLSATAIFDPASSLWQIVDYPQDANLGEEHVMPGTREENVWDSCIELIDDSLFLSFSGQIHKYDFKTRQWQILDFPGQKQSKLFAIEGHLYAANDETILEITDGGKGTRLLASTRRRPAVTALDSIDSFGSPDLFPSLNHPLCANIGSKIYGWDGKDWQTVFTMDDLKLLEPVEDGFIFRSFQGNLWVWQKNQSAPDLWLSDAPKPQPGVRNNGRNQTNNPPLHPLGKSPADVPLTGCVATFYKSNLYFLVDHTVVTNQSGGWTLVDKDGYNAKLVCLSRDWPEPLVVPLKFDLKLMRHDIHIFESSLSKSTWMHFAGDNLYIGQADTLGLRTDNIPEADRLGYWTIPISEIEANIEAQKQVVLAKKHDDDEAKRQLRDKMLAKYDHNHNGVIDTAEKEEALDDPAFIESELDMIDTNHNGWLDADELAYFDANKNKTLEPKEQAGIEIAQHLLAQRLLKQFDANGDGLLDQTEFNNLQDSIMGTSKPRTLLQFVDQNHDNRLDLGELETFLQQQTRTGLRSSGMRGSAVFNQMRTNPGQAVDPRQMFKAAVESYWQNPVVTNRPPLNRAASVGDAVTNGAQGGKP
jgi:Ca2+-binding EF-hand superfamily protein